MSGDHQLQVPVPLEVNHWVDGGAPPTGPAFRVVTYTRRTVHWGSTVDHRPTDYYVFDEMPENEALAAVQGRLRPF